MKNIPTWLGSSADPTQLSLTIVSAGKTLSGIIVFIAVLKGVDPAIASAQWGQYVANFATLIPALYAAYHASEAIWGMTRKAIYWIFGKETPIA